MRSSRIRLQQLRALIAVDQEGGFRRAADLLNTSQSAISRTIQTLEAELGTPMFERDARGVKASPVGKILIPYARRVMNDLNEFSYKAIGAATGEIGQLKIAYNEIAIRTILPTILSAYHEQFPSVDLRLINQGTLEMCPDNTPGTISRGEVDIGFLVGPILDPSLDSIPLLEDELVLVVSQEHQLARRTSVAASELADEHILLWTTDQWQIYTRRINNICRSAGFLPRPSIMVEDNEGAFALVEQNVGVIMIARTVAAMYEDRLSLVRIENNPEPFPMFAAWRCDNPSPLLANFVGLVEQAIEPG